MVLATNGQDIYAVGADGAADQQAAFVRYDNTLGTKTYDKTIGSSLSMDIYFDPTSCFVFVAGTHDKGDYVKVGSGGGAHMASELSSQLILKSARDFVLFRTDSDYGLDAALSTCPTPSALPSATTPVSIAGNGSELGYIVYSGKDGWGK